MLQNRSKVHDSRSESDAAIICSRRTNACLSKAQERLIETLVGFGQHSSDIRSTECKLTRILYSRTTGEPLGFRLFSDEDTFKAPEGMGWHTARSISKPRPQPICVNFPPPSPFTDRRMFQDMGLPGPYENHMYQPMPMMVPPRALEEFVYRLAENIHEGTMGETGSRRGNSNAPETLPRRTSESVPMSSSPDSSPDKALPKLPTRPCGCSQRGRNLVVCIDGTSNKFGPMNTNVVELYSLLVKDGSQLTYYDSGIGTYARPSWRKFSYLRRILDHKIDLAIAWNFDRILLGAYRWLAEHYREGDGIFLFGFSRGAYQVRALSAMIDRVGLIHRGNEAQIPFAFELFASIDETKPPKDATTDRSSRRPSSNQTLSDELDSVQVAKHFKQAFSRFVQVHFVGAWDTVSSVGMVRSKILPGAASGMRHVCYFRHGLALDERRVKFLPEFVNGGTFKTDGSTTGQEKFGDSEEPRVKEVWFAGTHSDIGGGNVQNLRMDHSDPPLRWMSYEATKHGLLMHPFRGDWKLDRPIVVHESLKGAWRLLESLPIKRLSYKDSDSMVWWPHLGRGRRIQPGQSIHGSAFRDDSGTYVTRAMPPYSSGSRIKDWKHLQDQDDRKNMEIMVEDDLYSSVKFYFVDRCKKHRTVTPFGKDELKKLIDQLTEVLISAEGRRALHEVPDAAKYIIPLFWSEPSRASKREIPAVFITMDIRLLAAFLTALRINKIYLVKEKKAANMSLSMAKNELVKCETADESVMYLAIDHIDNILPRIFFEARALGRERDLASRSSPDQPGPTTFSPVLVPPTPPTMMQFGPPVMVSPSPFAMMPFGPPIMAPPSSSESSSPAMVSPSFPGPAMMPFGPPIMAPSSSSEPSPPVMVSPSLPAMMQFDPPIMVSPSPPTTMPFGPPIMVPPSPLSVIPSGPPAVIPSPRISPLLSTRTSHSMRHATHRQWREDTRAGRHYHGRYQS